MSKTSSRSAPLLLFIRGLPGSGKSYVAEALKRQIGSGDVVLLDPDKTDYSSKEYLSFSEALTEEGVDKKFHPYRFLRKQAYEAISTNKVMIWNQAFTNLDGFNKTIINLKKYADENMKEVPILVVEVNIYAKTAKDRIQKRQAEGKHGVSDEAFSRFVSDYRSFLGEGFNIVSVDGTQDVSKSVEQISLAISNLQ